MESEHSNISIRDEEEEEEELFLEPRLKYDRVIGEQAVKMLESDVITCICVNEKLIGVGAQSGRIWIMDHLGFGDTANIPVMQPHRSKVTRLDLDPGGNVVISCGNDYRVVVSSFDSRETSYVLNLPFMPKCIALMPNFITNNKFYVGERSLAVYERKKLFKSQVTKTLYTGQVKEGHITRCSCNGNYIAFTNDGGTRIMDRLTEKILPPITLTHDPKTYCTSKCPPSHAWLNAEQIAIGWADTVIIAKVSHSACEILYSWNLKGFLCSGISFILNNELPQIVFFGLKPEDDMEDDDAKSMFSTESLSCTASKPPLIQVFVCEPISTEKFRLVSEDRIKLDVRKDSQPFQYQFMGLPSCDTYFLIGPNDFVVATPYSSLDAVKWRIENNLWEEAWNLAKERASELEGTEYDMRTVGTGMVEYLIACDDARSAANMCVDVCGKSKTEWEWAVNVFDRHGIPTLLANVLPTNDPQLEPECYEIVLQAALQTDIALFKKLVISFNSDIYRTASIIQEVLNRIHLALTPNRPEEDALTSDDEMRLYNALAHLYVYGRNFKDAIKIYMDLKDPQVFRVIDKYHLFEYVKDQISELMQINVDLAIRLLLENEDSVAPSFVMSKLSFDPKLQMAYLTKLLSKNEGSEFADQAVRLYAEYDRKKLLPFLKENEHYNLSKALAVCTNKEYIDEMILLLGKSGRHLEALDCMLRQSCAIQESQLKNRAITEKDYEPLLKAIDYCKEHDDMDLWNHLINKVLQSSHFIARLLREAGTSIDPLVIIEKIPVSMDIPDLRRAVAKVLTDCADRVNLLKGCRLATYADSKLLLDMYLKTHAKTKSVNSRSSCFVCKVSVMNFSSEMRIFGCGHSAHGICSLEMETKLQRGRNTCYVCSETSREEFM